MRQTFQRFAKRFVKEITMPSRVLAKEALYHATSHGRKSRSEEISRISRHEAGHAFVILALPAPTLIDYGIMGIHEDTQQCIRGFFRSCEECISLSDSIVQAVGAGPSFFLSAPVRRWLRSLSPESRGHVSIVNLIDDNARSPLIDVAGPAAEAHANRLSVDKKQHEFLAGKLYDKDFAIPYWELNDILHKDYGKDLSHLQLARLVLLYMERVSEILRREAFLRPLAIIQNHFERYGVMESIRSGIYARLGDLALYTQCIQMGMLSYPDDTYIAAQILHMRNAFERTNALMSVLKAEGFDYPVLEKLGNQLQEEVDLPGLLMAVDTTDR